MMTSEHKGHMGYKYTDFWYLEPKIKLSKPKPPEVELLPCPHCGSKARYCLVSNSEWVVCEECDAQTPMFFTHGSRCDGVFKPNIRHGVNPAITLWNTRVS